MSAAKKTVLVVDDTEEFIQLLTMILKRDYIVMAANSGSMALELARTTRPDVVLMDVEMDGMDGYEACRQIKADPELEGIEVIFLSAHDTNEEKIAGYEAGGSDYLCKPVNAEELRKKVAVAIKNQERLLAIEADKIMAMQVAMTAMTSGSELGVVLECLCKSFTAHDFDQLGALIIEAVSAYQLNCTAQIRSSTGTICYSSSGVIPPIENELLTRLKDQGRIMQVKARLILNFGCVSLLIKNLPLHDSNQVGRLRDHLAILLESVDSKIASLELHILNELHKQQQRDLIMESSNILRELQEDKKKIDAAGLEVVNQLSQDLERAFISWGLSEEQENILTKIVTDGVDRYYAFVESNSHAEDKLKQIIQTLSSHS